MPEIINPVFAKTSQNARFLLSENERFGLVFVKTGSLNSGTGVYNQKPFTEDPASEGSNILVWFGSLCVLPSPWMYCEARLRTVGVPFYENWRGRGVFTRNGKTSLVHYQTLSFFAFIFFLNENSLFSPFQLQNHYGTCSLRFANLIFGNNYIRFASLYSQLILTTFAYLRFLS